MIIIGHPWIESPKFYKVFSMNDIKQSEPGSVVVLEPLADSHKLAQYCQKNDIDYAVPVTKLKEAIFANALGASYIICEEDDDAMMIQPIAQEYLFDTRLLVLINEEKEITKVARSLIDGVLFAEAIS
ncbi:MAG: hypothetical protein ABXS92_04320 [Sulfurimonas sp.]